MQYLQRILHLSCGVQRLPGYQPIVREMKCPQQQNGWTLRLWFSDENELRLLMIKEKDSKNTTRAAKASVKVINDYFREEVFEELLDKITLANVLKSFYSEAKNYIVY